MITGSQLRAAKSALKWTSEMVAQKSGISLRTMVKLEHFEGIPDARSSTLIAIQKAFESAGIEFVGTPDDGPGIRLHKKP